jgi:hypothetical protein
MQFPQILIFGLGDFYQETDDIYVYIYIYFI